MKTPKEFEDDQIFMTPFEMTDDYHLPTSRNIIVFPKGILDQYYLTSKKCRQIAKYLLKIADWKDELK